MSSFLIPTAPATLSSRDALATKTRRTLILRARTAFHPLPFDTV